MNFTVLRLERRCCCSVSNLLQPDEFHCREMFGRLPGSPGWSGIHRVQAEEKSSSGAIGFEVRLERAQRQPRRKSRANWGTVKRRAGDCRPSSVSIWICCRPALYLGLWLDRSRAPRCRLSPIQPPWPSSPRLRSACICSLFLLRNRLAQQVWDRLRGILRQRESLGTPFARLESATALNRPRPRALIT